MLAVTPEFVKKIYPVRDKWSHKGASGKLLVVGGSRRYRGAPALCGLAALRTGVDICTIAAPETAAEVTASFSPNLITEPLEGDYINPRNVKRLVAISKKFDALVVGNGVGRMGKSQEAIIDMLHSIKKPCVIDADALHMLPDDKHVLKKGWIITPHEKELYNLTGVKPSRRLEARVKQAKKFSQQYKVTVLLKGYKDVIAEGNTAYVNSTGNPYMTVGGTGDVLAGICGALMAMGVNSLNAAAAGAYICGAAGDVIAKKYGPGLLATDILHYIPIILNDIIS